MRHLLALLPLVFAALAATAHAATLSLPSLDFSISPDNGTWTIADKAGGAKWSSGPSRFGTVTVTLDGKKQTLDLASCRVAQAKDALIATFDVKARGASFALPVTIARAGDAAVTLSYQPPPSLAIDSIRLLDDGLAVQSGYIAVPVREGLLIPADSGKAFNTTFDTYSYEGCHMAMLGAVSNGAAALITWVDPYIAPSLRSTLQPQQTLSLSMSLRKSARAFTIQNAGQRGLRDDRQGLSTGCQRERLAGDLGEEAQGEPASRSALRRIQLQAVVNPLSQHERREHEGAVCARQLDIRRGGAGGRARQDRPEDRSHALHDGRLDQARLRQPAPRHPPQRPECGGDEAFARCCKRIRQLGFILCLHDNYQDMYKDSPSWDESYLQKNPDGKPAVGGKWAGGRAYITCSQRAVDLAKRPQNLTAVKKLTDADSYFIDTTYAAGLQECSDPKHPLTRLDDMKWKQAISDYAREVFGIFGSECGREWAIPHSDFFEGLTGVSGTYYHNAKLPTDLGATVIPLFELVYRDCMAMYGKYGYDIFNSSEYVLHHISIGRPLNYHSIPSHLYWKEAHPETAPLKVEPSIVEVKQTAPRRIAITYNWTSKDAIAQDWTCFVHFTDTAGQIKFQGDFRPDPPTSQWKPGEHRFGPFTVTIPAGLTGMFDIRAGFFRQEVGERPMLMGRRDRERRTMLGKIKVSGDDIEFIRQADAPPALAGDGAMYTRGDGGWTAGMHPMDRFLKNTHEILSPLNEITSRRP